MPRRSIDRRGRRSLQCLTRPSPDGLVPPSYGCSALVPKPLTGPSVGTVVKAWFLAFLLLAPVALAHEDHAGGQALLAPGTYVDHGKAVGGELAPGEAREVRLAFGGAPFWAGWLWAVYGTTNGTLELAMAHGNETVREWTWEPGAMRLEVGLFPVEDWYALRLHNPTATPIRYDLSYDQTCDCRLKAVPYDGGYAWTNIPLEAGQTAHFSVEAQSIFLGPGDVSPRTTLTATLLDSDGTKVLREWTTTGPFWNASVTAKEPGTYYVLLRADSGASEAGAWRFLLLPTVDVEDASLGRLPFILAGLSGVVLAAYGLGRIRRR